MCGIVGIVAKSMTKNISYKEREMFEQMLTVDALRGEDSTGVYFVNKHGNVKWVKSTALPNEFLKHKDVKDILSESWSKGAIMVGHNRKATQGVIKSVNAHPFTEKNIILVHNGTLRNHKALNAEVEVDSHAIAHAIVEHGVEQAISKIDGAFAVAAYDIDRRELHLFRNKERPLWLAEFEDFWAFASEPWIITGCAWRNSFKPKAMFEIDPGKLYTFDINENLTKQEEPKEVELYKEPTKSFGLVPWAGQTLPQGAAATTTTPKRAGSKTTINEFINYFRNGKTICFKPDLLICKDTGYKSITGRHSYYTDVHIKAFCKIGTTIDTAKKYQQADMLTGVVTSVRGSTQTGEMIVYLTDVDFSSPIVSANGTLIDEEYSIHLSGTCNKCQGDIDEEDIPNSYIRMRRSGQFVEICPTCVAEKLLSNPSWGNIHNLEIQGASM